jgi:TPR repeat protein
MVINMSLTQSGRRLSKNANDLFARACQQWERGKLLSAFRLFLHAAKAGDAGSQLNLGYLYDYGIGVQSNRRAAEYWYRRAYVQGMAGGANNIGTLYRDEQRPKRALLWFRRATKLGDVGANLEIAKYYLNHEQNTDRAVEHLEMVIASDSVSEAEKETARKLRKKVLFI